MEVHNLIEKEIESRIDLKYLKFHSSLVPNVSNIKGVRIPDLRIIAKTISKRDDIINYLECTSFDSYEQLTIYGLVIGYSKLDFNIFLNYLKKYISHIDNWATCDIVVSNLKFTKNNLDSMYKFLLKYLTSKNEFEVRFVVVMFLNYYIVDQYIDEILLDITKIKHSGYYVKMAVAWLISICYIKYKDITLDFLKNVPIDHWIYQKSLQKIIESNRVSGEEKEKIRKMKKKKCYN